MSDRKIAESSAALPDAASTTRVLLVDDQAIVAEAIRRMLATEENLEYHYCADPARAIAEAVEFQPTVILQDLVMPDIDGMMLLRFFRANPVTKNGCAPRAATRYCHSSSPISITSRPITTTTAIRGATRCCGASRRPSRAARIARATSWHVTAARNSRSSYPTPIPMARRGLPKRYA